MNIFNKVTLESMKKSYTRTIVTIIGVILSAAMITAIATFGVSLLDYMVKGAIQKDGDWHVEFVDIPSSFVEERAYDEEVDNSAAFENIGYAKLDGSKNENKPYLFIAGFNDETFNTLPIKLISGRLPQNEEEILVSLSVSANGGVELPVGDTLSFHVGNRMKGDKKLGQHDHYAPGEETFIPKDKKSYKIVGICQRPGFEEHSAAGYTLITKVNLKDKGDSFNLFVKLKNPYKVHTYASSTASNETYIFNDNVLRFMGLSDDKVFNIFLYAVGGVVAAIIIIGSIFLIYNSFNISMNERIHQFGILSSIGATSRQLLNSVLFEGVCIGTIGIPIGVIVGIGSIGFVISVVAKNFSNVFYSNVQLTLKVSAPAIIIAAVISMITILISAYIPAKKAANTPAIQCIRQTNEVKIESKDIKISKFTKRIYGLNGILALKNFRRNKKHYRSVVLSLVLSIVMFVSTNAFVEDLKEASEGSVAYTTYDIGLATQNMDDREMFNLYDKLKIVDGVYESSYQALISYSCDVKASNLTDAFWECIGSDSRDDTVNLSMKIQFLEDSEYLGIIKELDLPENEYTRDDAKIIALAKVKDQNNENQELHDMSDMFKDTTMNFNITPKTNGESNMNDNHNVAVKFVEVVPPDKLPVQSNSDADNQFYFNAMAPYSLKEKLAPSNNHVDIKGLTFKSKVPAQSVEEMKSILEDVGTTSQYTLYNFYEILEQNRNIIFVVNIFSYIFIIMISLIAIANVFNTISTNIKLRKRELAMLRSVGMSEGDFQKMMNFECIFYGMKALILGLPISAISSLLIYKFILGDTASNSHFIFPWGSMLISVFSVFGVVFITMLYAINKIKKENIIDALRDDII